MSHAENKRSSRFEERFHILFENLFQEIDQDAIAKEMRSLEASHPDQTREWLAKLLVRRAAMSAALIGAGAGAPGGALGILAMAPDIFNLVRQQSRLVLSIAFLYGQSPGGKERFREVVATLAISMGASAGRQSVRYLVQRGLEGKAARSILSRIAGRFTAKKIPTLAPIIGSAAGAGINYLTVHAAGKLAIDYYSRRLDESSEQIETKTPTPSSGTEKPAEKPKTEAPGARQGPKKPTTSKPRKPPVRATKKAATKSATPKTRPPKSTASRKRKTKKEPRDSGEESR